MTTSESKSRFFTKRIDSHNESNRIDLNRELECSSKQRHRPISSCRRRDVQQWAQDRAFAVAGPRAWDSLPDAIRRSPYLATFKRF